MVRFQSLRWPLPAVLVWAAAWAVFVVLARGGVSALLALALASGVGVLASLLGATWWRRLMIGLGFPLSLAASGLA